MSKKVDWDDDTKILVGRIWRDYLTHHKKTLAWGIFAMLMVAIATTAQARLIQPAFDYILEGRDPSIIWLVVGLFVFSCIMKGVFNYLQTIAMMKIGYQTIADMQGQMFKSLISNDIQHLDNEGTSKQISRFTSDVHYLRDTVSKVFVSVGREIFVIIGLLALCFSMNWQMSLVAFVVLPIIIIPVAKLGKRIRSISTDSQVEMAEMTAIIDDALKGARQVKAYNMQAYEQERSQATFDRLKKLANKVIRTKSISYPFMETVMGIMLGGIMAWGGYNIYLGEITVGTFMTFFVAISAAYQPIRSLANLNASLQQGLSAAKRIFDVIDARPTITDKKSAKPLDLKKGTLEFNNVDFYYDINEPILQNITLKAQPKQTIALVGQSGGGKSTILNLIPRFYDVIAGDITIDGQNIKNVTLQSLREHIAVVSQDTWLFNDTIAKNIEYGRMGASHDDIVTAAKSANAHDFIEQLPDGYNTPVGERGLRLSGGQRQRIAIARAMLKNAPILLLDEATSALDTESERKVQQALEKLMTNRTTLVIAHRLSTIVNAHKIYVIEQGKIIESGNHKTLMQKNGTYKKLYSIQNANKNHNEKK